MEGREGGRERKGGKQSFESHLCVNITGLVQ